MNLRHEGVETHKLLQLEMMTISLEVLQHLSVLDKRLLFGQEWKVWEGHHLLGQICLEVLVHRRVYRQTMLVLAHVVSVDPGAPDGVRLLEDAERDPGTGGEMSGGTETSSSSS